MSIISDALKKVEGNSHPTPEAASRSASEPPAESPPRSTGAPPLFSVWSIVLSTIMVLLAAGLLLATWHTNRSPHADAGNVPVAPAESSPGPATATNEEASVTEASGAEDAAANQSPPRAAAAPVAAAVPAPAAPVSVAPEAVEATPPVRTPASEPAGEGGGERIVPDAPAPPSSPPTRAQRRDELELTGVVYTPRTRVAHINGRILPEGAEIRGYRIVTISRESVRLRKGDKFYILRLSH